MKKKIYGIYIILNKINKRYYIGKHKDILYRFEQHKRMLLNGDHYNEALQLDYDLYGLDNFEFIVIKTIPLHKQNLSNLAYLEAKTIYETYAEDYRNNVLYNHYSFRDEIIFHVAKLLIRENYKFDFCRVKIQSCLFDFIIYDDKGNITQILDVHNADDPRNFDQSTIEKRKLFAKQMGVLFTLLDSRGFFSNKTKDAGIRLPVQHRNFNLTF